MKTMRHSEGGSARRMSLKAESGFSLIELLIVIAILGVLAGIVVFAVGGFSDAGEDEACKTNQKSVVTALEAFKSQSQNWTYVSGKSKGYPDDETRLIDAQFILDWPNGWTYNPSAPAVGVVQHPDFAPATWNLHDGYTVSSADCGITVTR